MTRDELKTLKVTRIGDNENFEQLKDKYKDYDVVYSKTENICRGAHKITIYKQPEGINNYDLAFVCDGFFFDVTRCGNILTCWYD